MWKTIYTGISGIALLFLLCSCASFATYSEYSRDMFEGKRFFKDQEYKEAQQFFQKAVDTVKDSASLTYLAITCYKTDNLNRAEQLIIEADKLDPNNYIHLRTKGYKALILLKKDKKEGMAALKEYIDYYRHSDPLMTIDKVEGMWRSGNIDMNKLEDLVEEQVSWWENDVEQYYSTGTGFYDRHPWPGSLYR
jgi:tetratricopeptide (TPR) repeat protein